jgi:dihydroxyacetone kinase phosphoprotein-dependent L subunit
MTWLINDPSDFADEALAGFAASQPDRVAAVPGGVVRATASPDGQVAIIMGGGSGHFPAFAGWVGAGFGHGAACGNVFASPSEAQIYSVARAADNGGGLLFAPINYAGDILHFTAAAERLRGEGVDVRLMAVTDDIASGPSDARSTRRGIAGSLIVLKIAGAAAEEGRSLDEVEAITIAANDATRSFGVAFSGCTLPGADAPLFTVPAGRMAVGLGIHGEPGIDEVDLTTADGVADILLDGLFLERPAEPGRAVAVLVNGLGTVKYDELALIFGRVRSVLEDNGMRIVAPVVDEQVTSLDMAGVSLSLSYLDDELERLWLAGADSASFSRSTVAPRERREITIVAEDELSVTPGSPQSQADAALALEAIAACASELRAKEGVLGELDAVAGDGDHGIGMSRGIGAALAAARDAAALGAGIGSVLGNAGERWSAQAGGTSGALWGAGLVAAGTALGDTDHVDPVSAARAARAFLDAIQSRGNATVGEKTMIDAIVPFVETLEAEYAGRASLADGWARAAEAATRAAERTADIVATHGRSRLHGERSLGTPDPGAISFALVVSAVRDAPLG